jgi:hypothetical protein
MLAPDDQAVADAPGHQTLDDVALLALRATG